VTVEVMRISMKVPNPSCCVWPFWKSSWKMSRFCWKKSTQLCICFALVQLCKMLRVLSTDEAHFPKNCICSSQSLQLKYSLKFNTQFFVKSLCRRLHPPGHRNADVFSRRADVSALREKGGEVWWFFSFKKREKMYGEKTVIFKKDKSLNC
jgi:hypothetical protein